MAFTPYAACPRLKLQNLPRRQGSRVAEHSERCHQNHYPPWPGAFSTSVQGVAGGWSDEEAEEEEEERENYMASASAEPQPPTKEEQK